MIGMPIYSAEGYQHSRVNGLRALPALVAGLIIGLAMFASVSDKRLFFIVGSDI